MISDEPTPEQILIMRQHAETWRQAKAEAYREVAAHLRRMSELAGGFVALEVAAEGIERLAGTEEYP